MTSERAPQHTAASTGAGVSGRSDAAHEAQCRRCGVSCHLAIPVNDVPVMIPGLRCQYLAPTSTGFDCTVYADRFKVAPWCHHADVAGPQGFLARDCPYVLAEGFGRGKIRLSRQQYDRYWPAILGELLRVGVPEWIHRAALLSMLTAREGGVWQLTATSDGLLPTRRSADDDSRSDEQ
ncbi:MAG: hypothetical protein KC502_03560 [Myxococcales bacterium]|nr:hypothetical protein [Myxococcales bacterium]